MKRKVTKGMLMTALICGTISILPHGVYAEEVAEEEALQGFTLDQVVVTATRTPVEAFKAQANVDVVTSEKIEKMHYKDLYQALRDVPGVQTYSYGQDGYLTSDGFRINGSNRVVILVDGVRANQASEIYSPGVFGNLENIERVEVLKGAASALYGADAQGGVINIITKKAGRGNSKVFLNGGSYGKMEYGAILNTKVDKLGIRASAKKLKNKDYKAGDGKKVFNDSQSNSWNFGLSYELKENSNIDFNYDNFNNRVFYRTPGKNDSNSTRYNSVNARIVWNHEFDKDTHNILSIGHHKTKYFTKLASDWSPSGFDEGTNEFKSFLVSEQFNKKLGKAHLLTAGIEHETTKVDKYAYTDWRTGNDPTGKSLKSTAYYLQDQWKITDKLNFIAGIRYTDTNTFDSEWTPSFNLGYDFSDKTNMYVAWNKFFDTPNLYQLIDTRYGNSELKAESGRNFEVGINHRFADDFTISAHYFYRKTKDMIGWDGANNRYINMDGEVSTKGFDIKLNKAFGEHWRTSIGYTYLNMPSTGDDPWTPTQRENYGGLLPRGTWNVGIDYTNKGFDAGLTGRGIIKRPGYYSAAGKSYPNDTYWVWDLNMSYKIKKNLKVYANVYNMFNQNYAEMSDVYWQNEGGYPSLGGDYKWWPMPGRTFLAGVEYTF